MIPSYLDPWSGNEYRLNPGGLYDRLIFAFNKLKRKQEKQAEKARKRLKSIEEGYEAEEIREIPVQARRAVADLLHAVFTDLGLPDGPWRDPDQALIDFEAQLSVDRPYGKHIEWMADNLAREPSTPDYLGKLLTPDALKTLAVWLAKNKGIEVTLRGAVESIAAIKAIVPAKPPTQGDVVLRFDDGWTVQQLTTGEMLDDEGELMEHCVGGAQYEKAVNEGHMKIYSLRDPNGFPHVTFEYAVKEKDVVQVQAKGNQYPKKHEERLKYIIHKMFNDSPIGYILCGATDMVSEDDAVKIITWRSDQIRCHVAIVPRAIEQYPRLAMMLAKDSNEDVVDVLAHNTGLAAPHLRDVVDVLMDNVPYVFVYNVAILAPHLRHVLDALFKEKNSSLLIGLARNNGLKYPQNRDIVDKLFACGHFVRQGLAENEALGAPHLRDVLDLFVGERGARRDLAKNKVLGTPPFEDLVFKLMLDEDMDVRRNIAHNKALNTPHWVKLKSKRNKLRYIASKDTVFDALTGLTWQRSVPAQKFTWQGAKDYAATLSLNGGGWRLPGVDELSMLLELDRDNPAIDIEAFPDTPPEYFWTTTRSPYHDGSYARAVYFSIGSSGNFYINMPFMVRCVR